MPEERLGRFRLLERLAIGGSAEVFRAQLIGAEGGERPVVVKRILPQYARDERFRGMFEQEARLLATLEHPNVVRLVDFGEVQGNLLLALEQVDGGDLGALLAAHGGRTMAPPLAAYIATEVATALDYVHHRSDEAGRSLGIIHRDVSPQNILLSTTGDVKLTDFGIAKSTQPRDRTATGVIKGKFAYLAPEQATPGSAVDARLDLFALGAVLYELLFGRPPFEGQSEIETLERLRLADLALDDSWLEPRDRALVPIVRMCLAREPDARFASAEVLVADLRRYLSSIEEPCDRAQVVSWVAAARSANRPLDARHLVGQLLGREDAPVPRGTAVFAAPARPDGARSPRRTILATAAGVLVAAAVALAVIRPGSARRETIIASNGEPAGRPQSPMTDTALSGVAVTTALPIPAAPVPERTPGAPRPPSSPGSGHLVVNSIPWAYVYVDGKRLGATPLRRKIRAGDHRILLKDGSGRTLRSFNARIAPGGERVFSFEAPRP